MPAGHFENGKGFRPQALSFNATNGERPVFAFRYDETSMAHPDLTEIAPACPHQTGPKPTHEREYAHDSNSL
jgi:hypothetical protein